MLSAVYLAAWLRAFVFTQIVEVLVYHVGFKVRPLKAFGASAITHPFVSWFFNEVAWAVTRDHHPNAYFAVYVLTAETFAYGIEALYLHALGVKRPWLWSIAANSTSLGLGFVSTWLLHMP